MMIAGRALRGWRAGRDRIGGMGANWHSFEETADLRKIAIRTKLSAVSLLRLSRGAFTER